MPERAIRHEDFSQGATNQYRYSRIRVVFPAGFDVCDSVIGVQGNMSGVTIRTYGSNVTRNIRLYKAGSTVSSSFRGITEPSISLQLLSPPTEIPRTGPSSSSLPPLLRTTVCVVIEMIAAVTTLTFESGRNPKRPSGSSF